MVTSNPAMTDQRRFGRAARLSLLFALLILLASTAQVVYRAFLPTDGWLSEEDLGGAYWEYHVNLAGAVSALQFGDQVIGVEGQSLAAVYEAGPPPFWQAGQTVTYDVRRGSKQLQVEVPLVHWTPQALIRSFSSYPASALSILAGVTLVSVGFLAFLKRPEDPAAQALLVFVAAVGALSISEVVPDGLYTFLYPLAAVATGFFSYVIFGALLLPALLAFTLVFPRPKPAVLRRPWLAYAPFLLGASIVVGLILFPNAWQIGFGGTLIMVLASVVSLLHSALTMRDAISRAQLLWAIGGFVLGLGLFALNFPAAFKWVGPPLDYWFATVANLGIPVIVLGLAMAVLRYRLFDIDVIIRRTTSYAVLTALLAFVYFGAVIVLQRLLTPFTGQSDVAVVLSTLLIAALFLPLRRRVQIVIDRRFFRRKYDAAKTLEAFAATVRNETDLDALTAELVRVIRETMEPESVSVWVKPVGNRRSGE